MKTTYTPENPPVPGDGMSVSIATDCNAYTVVGVSKNGKTIELQRDHAVRVNREDDIVTVGGFFAHTESPNGQQYEYTPDPSGHIIKVTWRERIHAYKLAGSDTKSPGWRAFAGRHESYDYNF